MRKVRIHCLMLARSTRDMLRSFFLFSTKKKVAGGFCSLLVAC